MIITDAIINWIFKYWVYVASWTQNCLNCINLSYIVMTVLI